MDWEETQPEEKLYRAMSQQAEKPEEQFLLPLPLTSRTQGETIATEVKRIA